MATLSLIVVPYKLFFSPSALPKVFIPHGGLETPVKEGWKQLPAGELGLWRGAQSVTHHTSIPSTGHMGGKRLAMVNTGARPHGPAAGGKPSRAT